MHHDLFQAATGNHIHKAEKRRTYLALVSPYKTAPEGFNLLICITLESKREKLSTNSSAIVNLHAIIL